MAFSYKNYEESDAVKKALEAIENHQATKPGEYQSQWTQGLQDALDKIQNRPAFSYDLTGDALYQQYKDRYTQQGQMAMLDTMGQASALTGGYGSSYGQSVGQQAYQGYLQGLSDQIPQLYQMALDKYGQEGQDLYNLYAILGEREASDYDRYQTDLSRWESALDKLYSQYNAERDYDYGKYETDRNYAYNQYIDDRNYQYQLERDKIEDARYAAAQAAARSYSSGSSGGSGSAQSTKESTKESLFSSKPMSDQAFTQLGISLDSARRNLGMKEAINLLERNMSRMTEDQFDYWMSMLEAWGK